MAEIEEMLQEWRQKRAEFEDSMNNGSEGDDELYNQMSAEWEMVSEFVATLEEELTELNGITMQKDY